MSGQITLPDLREALMERQGMVQVQPIFDVETGKVVFHEVLLRLMDIRGEEMFPKDFLPTAVSANLLPEIDLLTLHLLEEQMQVLKKPPPTKLSINVSRRTLAYKPYLDKLKQASWEPLLPSLMFEVKTNDIGQDIEALRALKGLKGAGICLCVDYQKGGAAVVKLAKQLGFDYIKIDAVSVSLKYTETELKQVQAACDEARRDGLKIIFERVEALRDLRTARKYNPHKMQGYFFAHPSLLFSRLEVDFKKYA
ncbi:MAG: EAL domain-containing protein [Pseudomonadaceae bacterium]|nr:EAL domain-containing protein [Pseudomonadaceae bacterium]